MDSEWTGVSPWSSRARIGERPVRLVFMEVAYRYRFVLLPAVASQCGAVYFIVLTTRPSIYFC